MATAAEKFKVYKHYATRAKFAEDLGDAGQKGTYLAHALDAVERTLAEHPGDVLCPDLQMARHVLDRDMLGTKTALDTLGVEVEDIWRSFADDEQRYAFARLLREEAGRFHRQGDAGTTVSYDRILRERALAAIDADPAAPIQVRMVELYATTLERTRPPALALGEGPAVEKTLPRFDAKETVADRRTALDALAERARPYPDSALGFITEYMMARFEQDFFHDTAASKAHQARMRAILENGAVDAALAEAQPLGEDSAVLHVLIGHTYYDADMLDAALAQYRFYLDNYPADKGPVAAAKLGALWSIHEIVGSTLEERYADLRAFIEEFHGLSIAESVAGQMGMEMAAAGDPVRAAELWTLLADKRRMEENVLRALQRAVDYHLDAKDVAGAVALYEGFMGDEADPECAADILEQAAVRCLHEADAAGAAGHFQEIVSGYPGTLHAARAQQALDGQLKEGDPLGAIALYAEQADLVADTMLVGAILDRAATLCLMQENRDAARGYYQRIAEACPDTPYAVNAQAALAALAAAR
jgi:TolA-binding protein